MHHLYFIQYPHAAVCVDRRYPCPDINKQGGMFPLVQLRFVLICPLFSVSNDPAHKYEIAVYSQVSSVAIWLHAYADVVCTQGSGLIILPSSQPSQPTRNNLCESNV